MASSWSRWRALTRHEQALFTKAWILLVSARLMWNLVPFRWIWKVAGGVATPPTSPLATREIDNIRRAIERASARVRGATCLTRGLAAAILLRFARLPHQLLIGVWKSGEEGFSAHAWVVSEEKIVVGNLPDLARYIPLPIGAAIPPLH